MTYTKKQIDQPLTKELFYGRLDFAQGADESLVDYALEIMSILDMLALLFSLWSYEILYFSVLEFKMNSDRQTNWLTGMCRRKKDADKSKATAGSLHHMYLDPKTMKTDPTLNFNDKKVHERLVQDEEAQDASKTILRRLSQIPSLQSPPGSPARLRHIVFRLL